MPQVWDADVRIDAAIAEHLIRSQFPQLPFSTLQYFGEGWDNAAFLLGDDILFRFPRRKMAAPLIENECRILPLLEGRLPLSIPVPVYRGDAEGEYPYSFAGYRLVSGDCATRTEWTDEQKLSNAGTLGEFLKALHGIEISEDTRKWAPGDEFRRADLPFRFQRALKFVGENPHCFETIDLQRYLGLMESLSRTPLHEGPTCWLHGDLYASHLLAHDHRICGVIDWGDVHLGDRAVDLSIAFAWLPPRARSSFLSAYGDVDDDTWKRAHFRALDAGLVFLWYGHTEGKEEMLETANSILLNAAV